MPGELRDWPGVSVVMPVVDEERHLPDALAEVLAQDYPGPLEVVLAVGPSRDATAEVAARLAREDPRVRVVDNPSGRTPAGLNAAVAASTHPVVARVDGHGLLSAGYLRRAVEVLAETGADNVGGVMAAEGTTRFERAVAAAYGSRMGLGGGPFHVGGAPGPADSVYLGVFRRAALERVGGFDESMHRAQDWELNYRLRRSGGVVWFDPGLQVAYRPRSGVRALAGQFFRTGQWRREVVRRHPETASPRYLAPPVAVAALAVGGAAGVVGALGGPALLRLGWAAPGTYGAVVLVGGLHAGRREPWPVRVLVPGVLVVMHTCWGAGFLLPSAGGQRGSEALGALLGSAR